MCAKIRDSDHLYKEGLFVPQCASRQIMRKLGRGDDRWRKYLFYSLFVFPLRAHNLHAARRKLMIASMVLVCISCATNMCRGVFVVTGP